MASAAGNEDRMTTPPRDQASLVQRIVQWLRAGYPEGVPQQDYVALLGILRRSLTDSELAHVVRELADDAAAHQHIMTPQLVEQRIQDIVKGPIRQEDIVRVSTRLAAAGWPLASPLSASASEVDSETRPSLVQRVVEWLRRGYPAGLPDHDYLPLVALLRRRLSDDEVDTVSRLLAEGGTIVADRVDIGTAVAKVTSELASEEDINRVRRYLSEHGWPPDLEV
jgi:hypothetical protein